MENENLATEELKKALELEKTPNTLIYIYQRVRIITDSKSPQIESLTYPPLLKTVRFFLLDRDREVRVAALRTLRYMTTCPSVLAHLNKYKIQHFIIRCFESEGKNQEKIEACKLIKNWLELHPSSFPIDIVSALIALGETENEELKEFVLEALRILCVSSPGLVALSQGVRVLVGSLTEAQILMENHVNTILTLIYLLNTEETRVLLKNETEILKLFSVFCSSEKSVGEAKFNSLLVLAKLTLKTLSKSWVGLFFLANKGFSYVLQAFRAPCEAKIKQAILESLEEMLNLQIETSQPRPNLLKSYLGLLVKALLEAEVVKSLENEARAEKGRLSKRCKGVLKKIYSFAIDLLPAACVTEFSTISTETCLYENGLECPQKSSGFLYRCCENISTEPFNYTESSHLVTQEIYEKFYVRSFENCNLGCLIKASSVLDNCSKWNWKLLNVFVSLAGNLSVFKILAKEKVLSALLNYFVPSRLKFSALLYHPDSLLIAETGKKLFLLLVEHEEGVELLMSVPVEDFFLIRMSFAEEIKVYLSLEIVTSGPRTSRLFTPKKVRVSMVREYLKWVSLLTFSAAGLDFLQISGLDATLLNISTVPHLSCVILPYLNYKEPVCKNFISISLQSPNISVKQLSMQQIHLLAKAGSHELSWAVRELVNLFYHPDEDTVKTALKVVTELNQDPVCLKTFIETGPQDLSKLGEEGEKCLISLLSSELGVEYLKNLDFIRNEIRNWQRVGHLNYIKKIEEKSEKGLNSDHKNYAVEINTPFSRSVEDKAEGLWLSRIPFFIKFRVVGSGTEQLFIGVVQVTDEMVFIRTFDAEEWLSETDAIEVCLMVGGYFLDNQGNESENEHWVRFDLQAIGKNENFENFGVVFHYSLDNSQVLFKGCSFRVKITPKASQKLDFPLHLYAELVKTEKGVSELLENIDVSSYLNELRYGSTLVSRRIAIWALGNIGTSEFGAKVLDKTNAVREIVKVVEKSNVLSLRGAAFQALCLIGSTKLGRKMLKASNWVCSDSNLAFPADCKKLFWIERVNEETVLLKRSRMVEERVGKIQLNQEEREILENVLNVSFFRKKIDAESFLKKKRQENSEVFENLRLFDAVMEHLAVFSFSLKTRKMIHKIFESIYRKQDCLDVFESFN